MNAAKIGRFTVLDPPTGWDRGRTNYFDMFAGAARFGSGRFLLREADYRELEQSRADGLTTLTLECRDYGGQQDNQELSIPVALAGATPYSRGVPDTNGAPAEHIVEVALFDRRVKTAAFDPISKNYNCQTADLGGIAESTKNGSQEWTWADAFADAGGEFLIGGGSAVMPTWKPRNLSWKGVPRGRVIDDMAARLFLVVGFRPTLGRWVLHAPGTLTATNSRLLSDAIKIGASGETISNVLRLPREIVVTFPIATDPSTSDPFGRPTYEKAVPTATGLGGQSQAIHCGEYWAVGYGGRIVNQKDLDAVAADLAPRFVDSLNAPIATYEIPGVWAFEPDGAIRAIRWICGPSGSLTMVRLNNGREWSPLDETLRTAREAAYNQTLVTIGEPAVHSSANGVKMLRRSSRVMFDAIIDGSEDSEGAAGDSGKFLYDFTEVGLKHPGEYGDWAGGYGGGTRTGQARNRTEEVGDDNEPIPDGTVVVVTEYTIWSDKGEPEKSYWIEAGGVGATSQWATIGGSSADGDNKWVYTATLEDSGEEAAGVRNGMELPNSGAGVQGNGVNVDNLPDGFEIQPIASGVRVRVWTLENEEGEDEYWFFAPNAVDGECTSDPTDPTKAVLSSQIFGW